MEPGEINEVFGRNVRKYRRAKGLSQEKLAEAIEKTFHTISNIERGASSTKISTAEEIAAALEVPLTDLFAVGPVPQADPDRQAAVERFITIAETCDRETFDAVMDAVELVLRVADEPKKTGNNS
jgi:transcriptional regulator with XRE-family HTH domain